MADYPGTGAATAPARVPATRAAAGRGGKLVEQHSTGIPRLQKQFAPGRAGGAFLGSSREYRKGVMNARVWVG